MLLAEKDLQVCSNFAFNENRNDSDLHYLQRIRVAALMTRVEIDIDLGDIKDAKSHIKRATEAVRQYDELARIVKQRQDVGPCARSSPPSITA